jgi:hypothetical protein
MEILGRERRRRWGQAEKLEIVAAVGVNGETLARVAWGATMCREARFMIGAICSGRERCFLRRLGRSFAGRRRCAHAEHGARA